VAYRTNHCPLELQPNCDLSCGATGRVLPATSIVVMLATDRSWAAVPRKTTSDLSALSCRPFCRNHRRTAASLLMAGVSSVMCMLTSSCDTRQRTGGMTRHITRSTRALNSSGTPNTEPCGTPQSHWVKADECPLRRTNCRRSQRYKSVANWRLRRQHRTATRDGKQVHRGWWQVPSHAWQNTPERGVIRSRWPNF